MRHVYVNVTTPLEERRRWTLLDGTYIAAFIIQSPKYDACSLFTQRVVKIVIFFRLGENNTSKMKWTVFYSFTMKCNGLSRHACVLYCFISSCYVKAGGGNFRLAKLLHALIQQ